MKKYKITLTLKNGIIRKHRIKCSEKKLNEILTMVDKAWKDNFDGYIQLKRHYYRLSELAHYHVERAWF